MTVSLSKKTVGTHRSTTFQVGVNTRVVGKTYPERLSWAGAWQPVDLSFPDLANHIGKGHPWMPGILGHNRERWQCNINYADVIALDHDNSRKVDGVEVYHEEMTISQAIAHPVINAHCGLLIESSSSKPEHHKFRTVFRLPRPVTDWRVLRICNRYLAHLVGSADPACKDASRFFFGAPGRQPILLNEAARLPETFIEDAIAWHEEIEAEEQKRAEQARQQWAEYQRKNPEQDTDALVLDALNAISPDCAYSEWIAIGMALAGMGDHWFGAWDSWSAGSASYNPREMHSRWKSFRGKRPAPEVVFGIAKRHGWRFSGRDPWQGSQRSPRGKVSDRGPKRDYDSLNRVIRFLRPAKGIKPKKRTKQGFAPQAPTPPAPAGALARFEDLATPSLLVTPETVPPFENWQRSGKPVLLFDPEHRQGIYDALIRHGYEWALDSGPTGDGKSTQAGEYLRKWGRYQTAAQWAIAGYSPSDAAQWAATEDGIPPELAENKACYFSAHYRKPSNIALESIPETVTGGALAYDHDDLLPSGQPSLRRVKTSDPQDIAPLCAEDDNVQAARNKGIDVPRGKDSPFCKNCTHFDGCGYLKALQVQRELPALRSHLSKGGKGTVAFVDEASRSITTEREITVTTRDLDAELGRLALDSTTKGDIAALASVLVQGLQYAIAERGMYGMVHHEIVKFLPDTSDLNDAIAGIEDDMRRSLPVDADIWESRPVSIYREMARVANRDLDALLDGIYNPDAKAQLIDELLQAGAIRQVLSILVHGGGALEITPTGQLKIQRPYHQEVRTLRQFQTRILLDATPDLPTLAAQLKVPQRDITQLIPVATRDYSNLTFTIVDGIGSCGRQRDGGGEYSLRSRLQVLAAHLVASAPDPTRTGLIDSKFYLSDYDALTSAFGTTLGHNWRDNQNTNKFSDCTRLICVNPTPFISLTAASTTWQTRHGSSQRSTAQLNWLHRQGMAHLLQEGGRPRAQWSSDQKGVYLVGANLNHWDILTLASHYPGCTVQRVHVAELCPDAAPRQVQTRRRLLEAIAARLQDGDRPTRNRIAADLDISGSAVSQQVKSAGGFERLVTLLETLYRATNPPGELTEEIEAALDWIGQALPELVAQYRNGEISQDDAIAGVAELVEMAQGWGLWLPDRALDSLHELFISLSPDWAIALMAPPPIPINEVTACPN